MSRIEEFQTRVTGQSRSVLGYAADLMEWSIQKNLKLAQDFADLTVKQVRVPVEAKNFSAYREGVTEVYGDFGQALRGHGEAYFSRLKEVPGEVVALFQEQTKASDTPKATKTAKAA